MSHVATRSIPYGRQSISDADVAAVSAALRDPMLTQGPRIAEFEAALARTVGARYAVAVNSGTAALHAAYAAAGIGPGTNVVTTPITFAATANAARYLGGEVRFADVDDAAVMLDPALAATAGDERTRVIAPVHFGGQAAPMEAIARLAATRGWIVVEDAAHALGARYTDSAGREHLVGACAHGTMACFSFHPVKHITTGEGGAVTTNDEALYRQLLRFRTHGITRDVSELHRRDEGPWYYEQLDLGFNYRLTDLQCALGLSQLERLDEFVERRRAIADMYDAAFARAGVRTLVPPSASRGSYHLYVIRVPAIRRRAIFDAMRAAGLGVNVHYVPVYQHPYYRSTGFANTRLPVAEGYYDGAISIPMFPAMTDDDVAHVTRLVVDIVGSDGR